MNKFEIDDVKLSMFLDKTRWEEKINGAYEKKINLTILRKMCTPIERGRLCCLMLKSSYSISPPHIELIPKDDGTFREVYANEEEDRIILSIINDVYCDLYHNKIHKKCVSYQKGISVQKIIKTITNELKHVVVQDNLMGYKCDLSKYFDSVNRETINHALKELDTDSVLDKIMYEYYNSDFIFNSDQQLVTHFKSLAQGCAFGSFLANYVLRDIDAILDNFNIIYYRYSDDLLILGKESSLALSVLKVMLEEKGLQLNPNKVQELHKHELFTFLGYKINSDGSSIDLSDNKIKEYKRTIREILRYKVGQKPYNKKELAKVIKEIQKFIYSQCEVKGKIYGWMDKTSILTNTKTIATLDNYTKDRLKSFYTGKNNHTHNINHCPNDILRECGYMSMMEMHKALIINRSTYEQLKRNLLQN